MTSLLSHAPHQTFGPSSKRRDPTTQKNPGWWNSYHGTAMETQQGETITGARGAEEAPGTQLQGDSTT